MSHTWVIGGNGLLGLALKKLAPDFRYILREEFELGVSNKLPFKEGDTLIDMVPPPFPRLFPNLNATQYHDQFTKPHCEFIQALKKINLQKYVFISSGGAVYGENLEKIPFVESDHLRPLSLYGESKKITEEAITSSGISYTILRPSNIFDSLSLPIRPSGLIGTCIEKLKSKVPISIYGSLDIIKDYVANEDVAQAILLSLNFEDSNIFNIGSGKKTSIREIIASFEKRSGAALEIEINQGFSNDVQWMVLNPNKAKNILNFSSRIDVLNWIEQDTNLQS